MGVRTEVSLTPLDVVLGVGPVFLGVLLVGLLTLVFVWQSSISATQERLLRSLGRAELEDQKLREEIRDLQNSRGFVASIPSYGALLAAIGAGVGLIATAGKQLQERRAEREQRTKEFEAERRRKEAELREREAESLRRFDESMKLVITNLASANPIQQ